MTRVREIASISYAARRIFGFNRSCCELTVEMQDGSFDHERRLPVWPDPWQTRQRPRAALGRVNGFLKNMIEAIANSKMRRIERELELRGYRFDRFNNDWVSCNSSRAGISQGLIGRGVCQFSKLIVRVEDYMRQLPFRASALVFHLRRAIGAVVTFLRSLLGRAGPQIPPGRALHARSRTEMAGKAQSWSRVARLNVRWSYGHAQQSW